MEIIVIPTHATGEYDSTMDCDYAAVSATGVKPRLTRLMTTAASLDKTFTGLKGIEVWDSTPTILSRANAEKLIGEEELERADQSGGEAIAVEVSKTAWDAARDKSERVEGFVLHVSEDTVYWEFRPKHTTVGCETVVIPADLMNTDYEGTSGDARLMAAAPELLAACQLCLARDDIAEGELGNVLRAAIDKAEGR